MKSGAKEPTGSLTLDEASRLLPRGDKRNGPLTPPTTPVDSFSPHSWPNTYEQSIALLARTIQSPENIEKLTQSPKPGASPALYRLVRQEEAAHSEDYAFPPLAFGGKAHSLDFSATSNRLSQSLQAHAEKDELAKQYRASVLDMTTNEKKSTAESINMGKEQSTSTDGKSSMIQSTFNLVNIMMGMGLLGLPYVFRMGGWLGGTLCLLTFSAVCWRTAILIGRELNGDPRPLGTLKPSDQLLREPLASFPDLAYAALGPAGRVVISCVLYFELFSATCVILVASGDHLHELLPNIASGTLVKITAALSLFPTVVLKTPALLSYLSVVGTIATILLVLTVVAAFAIEGDLTDDVHRKEQVMGTIEQADTENSFFTSFRLLGMPVAIGMTGFTFAGHAVVPAIFSSMRNPHEYERMVTVSFSIVTTSCLAIALSGYFMFGDLVESEVTLSLAENSRAAKAMTFLTGLMVLTGFSKITLTMFPLALGLEELVTPHLSSERMVDVVSAGLKFALTGAIMLVAVYVPNFAFLVAITGMVCTMTVSVAFPAAAHLKLFRGHLSVEEQIVDYIFLIAGVFFAVVGTWATLKGESQR